MSAVFKRGDLVVFGKLPPDNSHWDWYKGLKPHQGGGYHYIRMDPEAVMIICNDSVEHEWWIKVFCNTSMSVVDVMEASLKLV